MSHPGKPAVILVSGGLDSATLLAVAQKEGYQCYALSFDYGQRHRFELEAARQVCDALGAARHVIVPLDLRALGGSALTADIDVPKDRADDQIATGIPVTYVPARNTIFLAVALGWAEVLGAFDLFIGVNAVDYSGYPDCRPEFIAQFETLANLATKAGVEGAGTAGLFRTAADHNEPYSSQDSLTNKPPVGAGRFRIHTPLIHLTKADIIRRGLALGVDYGLTHSCYDPDARGRPCGRCDSCQLRAKGFAEAGVPDPGVEPTT